MTHRWMRCWLAIGCLSGAAMLMAQSPASPARLGKAADTAAVRPRSSPTGAIVGRVADRRGQPQAGVAVTILRQDGKFVDKAYTQPDGQFRLGNLLPGLYAAEIAPPSFLPVWKSAIAVEPGAEYRLDISLLSLADSLEIGIPQDLKAASEDWKWTLRAAYPARPILRFEPANAAGKTLTDPRERALRGTVQFLAGNDSDGFGQDPGLRTAFDMAYALPASQQLAVAGFAGWERSTPAASMHAAWNRASAEGNSATLSVTVRQLFLPSEYWLTDAEVSAPTNRRVQSLTVGYEEEKVLGDRLRLHVGSLYDTLSFGRRMTRWSPFARLAYSPSETSRLTIAYTAANPRVLPAESERDSRVEEQVLAIPQISSDGASHPVLEGGSHVETQWEQQLTPSLRIQAAGFYDRLSQTAVSMAFAEPADFASSLLRDPFSDRYFLSAGGSASPGARVAVAARLSPRTELIVGYSYAGTVEAP
ncbi:MAG TPA: carboxypeptidase-like regulatory domain-containing protein, partial [Terriglobia bacterium]|nr:carboxypeptidase-like regulatory domain-containing protein [Terriglobia bacterium]